MLPAIGWLVISQHIDDPVPLLEGLSVDQVAVMVFALLSALVLHEVGHVLAGVSVRMPLGAIRLDWILPAVEYDPTTPEAQDPRRRLRFSLGGPLLSLGLAGTAMLFWLLADSGRWRYALGAFVFGNVIQALNGLPGRSAGVLFTLVGVLGLGVEVAHRPIAVTLLVVGLALLVLGNRSQSDGDLALAAWREIRAQRL